ncbi:porin [Shewanella dokdonensis]|uniref:Porin n=1 Tax=Shewanella dokdonensis TaxID=712036 RepID=A0ABX8DHA5_9GAMM|nr:porin [Shewanella dokdonensis]MCL1075800.1 porin [Shewanella dokdonensis]QVK24149.1 porin [Shewanella dokdonensis]
MKKSFISASVATVLAAASFGALADGPSFYGRFDLMLTSSENSSTLQSDTSGVHYGESGTYLENNFSWLGVKGSEKIADGIEIVYNAEWGFENTSNKGTSSSSVFNSRNTFFGVKTVGGTLVFGRKDTVFKNSEGGIDLFGNTNADMDRMLQAQSRVADGVFYYSPKIADLLTINANYQFDDNNETTTSGDGSSQYAVSATLGDKGFKAQNYYAAAAYNKGINGIDAYRIVGQVKLDQFKVGALYQQSENVLNSDIDGNTYLVNVSYNLNGVNLKAEYIYDDGGFGTYFKNISGVNMKADTEATRAVSDVSISNIIVGADYKVAKTTLLYGHYAHYEGDYKQAGAKIDLDDDNVFSVGVRYDF